MDLGFIGLVLQGVGLEALSVLASVWIERSVNPKRNHPAALFRVLMAEWDSAFLQVRMERVFLPCIRREDYVVKVVTWWSALPRAQRASRPGLELVFVFALHSPAGIL